MFKEQAEAIELYCTEKFKSHPENVMADCGMGDRCIDHLVTPTRELPHIMSVVHNVTIGGYLLLLEAVMYAHEIWFCCEGTELGTHLPKRIVLFARGQYMIERMTNFLTPWLLMQAITATDTFFMFHLRLLSLMPYRGLKSSSLLLEEEAVLHLLVFWCSRTVQSRRKRLLQVKPKMLIHSIIQRKLTHYLNRL
nr:hypothetical protein [Tanacetum cinerariifolium]